MRFKCAELMWMSSELGAKYFAGYQPFINLTIGGQKRSGGDACNDLTYLIMDAVRFVKVYQPSLACRIHNQSPQQYMEIHTLGSSIGLNDLKKDPFGSLQLQTVTLLSKCFAVLLAVFLVD